jgi:outer membrane immunogenic protein
MRSLALAVSMLAVSAVAASAADLAARPYTKAPVAAPVELYNWTGFYVGGNVGGVWERGSGTTNFFDPTAPARAVNNMQANSLGSSALIGGLHAGYNWQMARWVFGVEADWDWTNAKNSFCRQTSIDSLACVDNNAGFLTLAEKTQWLGSARGRVGYTWDRFMIYGTGGAAWGKIDSSINANCLRAGCGSSVLQLNSTANFSNTQGGWVAGVGIEAMLNANWIVRAEYLHYDLGSITSTLNLPDPVRPQSATWSRSYRYDTVRAGLSYKFGGPVVAKY